MSGGTSSRSLALLLTLVSLGTALMTPPHPAGASARPSQTFEEVGAGRLEIEKGPIADQVGAATRALLRPRGLEGTVRFEIETVRRSPIGRHVRGRQFRGGVPVDGTWLVGWVRRGRLERLQLRYTAMPGHPLAAVVTEREATLIALGGRTALVEPTVEEKMVGWGRAFVHVWRVTTLTSAGALQVDVDARTGEILRHQDPSVYEDTTATVFDPNPVVALKDSTLRQQGPELFGVDPDLDEQRLTSALVTLPMRGVDAARYPAGRLVGPSVDVQGPAPLTKGNSGFTFTRGDPRFETTMAYTHLDRLQRYFKGQLGLDSVNAEPQRVYAVPVPGFDNSFYVQGSDLIVLGSGGVDDGEDAEVILHEYGHAIHDDQVPGWGNTHEGGAMGEGFGDLLAAAFFARTSSGGFQDTCVADWDATSYSDADPPCLRRLDEKKKYPGDMTGAIHADGEIWSGFLWKLRDTLGTSGQEKSDNILGLVLVSHELLTPNADFKKAIAALRQTAKALGRTDWLPLIKKAAAAYGLNNI